MKAEFHHNKLWPHTQPYLVLYPEHAKDRAVLNSLIELGAYFGRNLDGDPHYVKIPVGQLQEVNEMARQAEQEP